MKIDHAEIKKRLMVFALSLIIIHRIILLAAKGTALASSTCVETDEGVYFCTDDIEEARQKAKKSYRYYLNKYGGAKQTIMGNKKEVATMRSIQSELEPYLRKIIEENGDGEGWLKEQCINQHKNCIFWTMKGECTSNPTYMEEHCALACKTCHKLLKKETTEDETCSQCSADQEQCM